MNPPAIEELLLAVESEPKVLALAVPHLFKEGHFTSRGLTDIINDYCDNHSHRLKSTKTLLAVCKELTDQGVFKRIEEDSSIDLNGQPHGKTYVFTYLQDKELFTYASLLSLKFMNHYDHSLYSFLGRFHRHNTKAPKRMKAWYRAINRIRKARHVEDEGIQDGKYLTLKDLMKSCSSLPKITVSRRLEELEKQGYLDLYNQNSEVGQFSKDTVDFLLSSQSDIDKHLANFLILREAVDINGSDEGPLILRNNIYDYFKTTRYKKLHVERRITELKKKGLYKRVHKNNHLEIRVTDKGRCIVYNFLDPLNQLRNSKSPAVVSAIKLYFQDYIAKYRAEESVSNAIKLYRSANPNIR